MKLNNNGKRGYEMLAL